MAQERNKKSLSRKAAKREPYDKVLIVCEGEKTEPLYLKDAARYFQIHTANILITGEGGAAPISIVEYALREFNKTPDYDRVYCVFDRDQHTTFNEACEKIEKTILEKKEKRKKIGKAHFEAIISDPCFEYWLLLHYIYTTKPFANFDAVNAELRKTSDMADYQKGKKELFELTRSRWKEAAQRASLANQEAQTNNTTNPTTKLHKLMEYLEDIKNKT